ncbi:putative arogenate dehydratase [Helianthus annuus]|nr:putative arogenate dehydratase [Helianthus annuus]
MSSSLPHNHPSITASTIRPPPPPIIVSTLLRPKTYTSSCAILDSKVESQQQNTDNSIGADQITVINSHDSLDLVPIIITVHNRRPITGGDGNSFSYLVQSQTGIIFNITAIGMLINPVRMLMATYLQRYPKTRLLSPGKPQLHSKHP